ncbi:MAG: hypothetical protein NT007_00215 [Candidatus Kapabacteria bacterium]|nr:hypothetical protein [Candidatus Kapabacteria bacterium]
MEKIISIILLCVILITFQNSKLFANNDTNFVQINGFHRLESYSKEVKRDNYNLWISLGSLCVSIVSIFIIILNLKRQIKSSEKLLIRQFSQQNITMIRETIVKLLIEISKPDSGKISQRDYVSEEHKIYEMQLRILLNKLENTENDLISCITKFRFEEIHNKNVWIEEILQKSNKLITKTTY